MFYLELVIKLRIFGVEDAFQMNLLKTDKFDLPLESGQKCRYVLHDISETFW